MKGNAEIYRILQRKYLWARNAAEWCRVKAATSRDKAVSAIYADIANEAETEARKIFELEMDYMNRYWDETYGADTTPADILGGVYKKEAI